MRFINWSVRPPASSPVADHCVRLVEELSPLVDIAAGTDSGAATPAGALPIHHVGDDIEHVPVHDRALAEPGLLVLHDVSLFNLYAALHGGPRTAGFGVEARHAHGALRGSPADPRLASGWPAVPVDGAPEIDREALTMERRLVTSSRAVVVHDTRAAEILRARYPGTTVFEVPYGVDVAAVDPVSARASTGWDGSHVVVGVFGRIDHAQRAPLVALAFAEVWRRRSHARLLVAGWLADPAALAELWSVVDDLGLGDVVRVVTGPDRDTAPLVAAADVVVDVRRPRAGSIDVDVVRAFAAGRPVIVADDAAVRGLDERFCLRVPDDPVAEARALIEHVARIVDRPHDAAAAGRLALAHAAGRHAWPLVAGRYRDILTGIARTPTASHPAAPDRLDVPGVNVFADARATTGLAESARRHATALWRVGVPMTFNEFDTTAPDRSLTVPRALAELPRGKDHPVDLWLVNVNEFSLIDDGQLDRYTIGLWAWEFLEVPEYAYDQLPRMDELWVVSSFVRDAFAPVTDMPITVIPNVTTVDPEARADRARFGLADDPMIVLYNFSASSSDARKNPWGAIEAFRRAFRAQDRGHVAQFVLKSVDLHRFPGLEDAIREALDEIDGVLITEHLARKDMDTLLATCDVYLSLHRAEGFGMGMAEAMMLGKAVVATGYSGNLDFMPPGSAAVVGYESVEITAGDHRFGPEFLDYYKPGQRWAEPDVDQAAAWLRLLAASPERRAELGRRGAAAVEAWCGERAVGEAMARRLRAIAAGGLLDDARRTSSLRA